MILHVSHRFVDIPEWVSFHKLLQWAGLSRSLGKETLRLYWAVNARTNGPVHN
jgi:hypothetical protein